MPEIPNDLMLALPVMGGAVVDSIVTWWVVRRQSQPFKGLLGSLLTKAKRTPKGKAAAGLLRADQLMANVADNLESKASARIAYIKFGIAFLSLGLAYEGLMRGDMGVALIGISLLSTYVLEGVKDSFRAGLYFMNPRDAWKKYMD